MARWLLFTWVLALLTIFAWRTWPQPRAAFYRLTQERWQAHTLSRLENYERAESDRFVLLFTEADRDLVPLLLETGGELYDVVARLLQFEPADRVPVVLHPNRPALRRAFGWQSGESALGVYWRGTIHLLSPRAWIQTDEPEEMYRAFRELNPIAHELTHYFLDRLTSGNYPRWFTEGLAQWVEHQATGYLWIEPSSTMDQPLYSLRQLQAEYDQLGNQALAYRQSYLLVDWMIARWGEEGMVQLIHRLGGGLPFDRAVQECYGKTLSEIYGDWQDWVEANRTELGRRNERRGQRNSPLVLVKERAPWGTESW